MKIDNPLLSSITPQSTTETQGTHKTTDTSGSTGSQRSGGAFDQVELSNLGAALRDLALSGPDPAGHTQKIQEVSRQVRGGSYAPDPPMNGVPSLFPSLLPSLLPSLFPSLNDRSGNDRSGESTATTTVEVVNAIRADLGIVRHNLMHPGPHAWRDILPSLQSAISRLEEFQNDCLKSPRQEKPSEKRAASEAFESLKAELALLSHLFQNAYALHKGWLLMDSGGGEGYDATGQSTLPGGRAA